MPDSLLLSSWALALLTALTVAHLGVTALVGAQVPARLRLVIGVVALFVAQYLSGMLLVAAGLFGRLTTWTLLLALGGVALALLRAPRQRACLAADLAELRLAIAGASRARLAFVALPLLLGWLQALRGVVTPPLDWDFLTYHGPRAAFWLQESRLWPSFDAVGIWQEHSAMPPGGDLISAWAMSAAHSDLLVAPTWCSVWAALGLAAYAATRALGAERWPALLSALAVVFLPAAFQHMASGYIDNAVALGAIAGTACFIEGERKKNATLATCGLLGFAASAGMKHTALPLAAVAVLVWGWLVWSSRRGARWRLVGAVALVASVSGGLWYFLLTAREGNPMYPFPIELFGKTLPGARDSIPVIPPKPRLDFSGSAQALFLGGFQKDPTLHNGFGVAGALLLVASATALLWRRWRPRGVVAPVLVATGLLMLAVIMRWRLGPPALDHARYLLTIPSLAIIAVGASLPRAPLVLCAALVLELPYALPWRWGTVDHLPLGSSLVLALLVAGALFLAKRPRVALASGLLASVCAAAELRAPLRWDYYRAAAQSELLASGPVAFCPSSRAHEIWEHVADAEPMTLNVSAGHFELRTNWFIYPLLGTRLQHRLVHVRTGLHFPQQQAGLSDAALRAASRDWLDGLEHAGAQALVLYKPLPIEAKLAWLSPQAFIEHAVDTPGALLLSLR